MRLRLFDRIRHFVHPRTSDGAAAQGRHRRDQRHASGYSPPDGPAQPPVPGHPPGPPRTAAQPDQRSAPGAAVISHAATRVGGARAKIRDATAETAVRVSPGPEQYQTRSPAEVAAEAQARGEAVARVVTDIPQQARRPSWQAAQARLRAILPFTDPDARERPRSADGRRHCGSLEPILWRQWNEAALPPPEVVEAIDRLAELPERIKTKLAAGLDWIFVGPGGVPELDEMTALRGVPLPSGQASWDACAGAYGERKIVVGSQPSPTPDVVCHEVGHALDDLDSPPGKWQSDSAEFRMLYDQCQPHLASDFHRQPGGLGRKEFFADAFAAIASRQRPALVDMLSGDTRTALRVMLYFNRRYGI
jgi:hypothetical protein